MDPSVIVHFLIRLLAKSTSVLKDLAPSSQSPASGVAFAGLLGASTIYIPSFSVNSLAKITTQTV